jgi:hypothetical protein
MRVSSVAVGPVRKSRALQHHPRRCGSTGRQDVATPAVVRPPAFHQPDPRADARTTTRREAPTPPPSKPLLDGYRARHDALSEARFARTAVYSTASYTIPPHVAETMRHDCKLPPLAYKRRRQSPDRRGRQIAHTCTLSAHTRYWHSASIKPQGPGGLSSSSASLVTPLCKHHGATQYSAVSTPLLDVWPQPEPG